MSQALTNALRDGRLGQHTSSTPRPRFPVFLGLGYSFIWSFLCVALLEVSNGVAPYTPKGPSIFVGLVLCWMFVLLLWAVTGFLRASMAMSLTIGVLLAAINMGKIRHLGEPLVPSDAVYLENVDFLATMVSLQDILWVVGIASAAWVTVWLIGTKMGRRFQRIKRHDVRWKRTTSVRLVVFMTCGMGLWHATSFNDGSNLWRNAVEATGHEWSTWSRLDNYRHSGFVMGALYYLPHEAMEEPEPYSERAIAEVARRYGGPLDPTDRGIETNVVVILSESFADPLAVPGVRLEGDPMTATRAVMGQQWSGEMLTYKMGGGTANAEFEALTGQSISQFTPQTDMPYIEFVSEMGSYPSAVGWARSNGMRTVAIHPFNTRLYRRPEVYKALGFDAFIHEGSMRQEDRIENGFAISDASAYNEVVWQIRNADEPVLVHTVTVQNHAPAAGSYVDPIRISTASIEVDPEEIGHWARGIHHTDAALEPFLRELKTLGEDTVVVFFGDHWPGRLGDDVTVEKLGDRGLLTPFFVWSSENQQHLDLGATSATAFLPLALERAGVPLPPYYELLSRVRTELGVLRRSGVLSPDGHETSYAELTATQRQVLEDYRLVQYDLSLGERYSLESMWYRPGDPPR